MVDTNEVAEKVKRGRGRPRKNPPSEEVASAEIAPEVQETPPETVGGDIPVVPPAVDPPPPEIAEPEKKIKKSVAKTVQKSVASAASAAVPGVIRRRG